MSTGITSPKKQKRVRQGDPAEFGDVWLHVAISATHKAVISNVVGKRDGEYTQELALDLRTRILNRPQITADGYAPYIGAIGRCPQRMLKFE
jgi:hypothetical protein